MAIPRRISNVRELVRLLNEVVYSFRNPFIEATVAQQLRMLVDVWGSVDPIQWRIERGTPYDVVAAARVGSEGAPLGVQVFGSGDDDIRYGWQLRVRNSGFEEAARGALKASPLIHSVTDRGSVVIPAHVMRQVAAVRDAFPNGLGPWRDPYQILDFAFAEGPVTAEERQQAMRAVDRAWGDLGIIAREPGRPGPLSKEAQRRKRIHAKDRERDAKAIEKGRAFKVPPGLCRGFAQTLVRVMEESLLGDPMTIFVPDGSNENTGARGFRYFKAASSNADWWQELPDKLDRKEIRYAMSRVLKCEPLIEKRIEHRWLVAFIKDARKNGWCASFDGRASPLCVSPEPPMKRAKLKDGHRRVWLALNEPDYVRLLLDSRAVHESPNLFVTGILQERWADVDERAAIQGEDDLAGAVPFRKIPRPADDIPF